MGFKIVVDSCCDLTGQMLKDPRFIKVPLTIRSNGSSFIDNETFDQADLLWAMKQSEEAPSTACPSPQSYLDAYQGPEEEDVYVVTLSALLSGSHNSAEQARMLMEEDHPNKNVYVFNSCSASSGEVLVALKVRELAESGAPFKHVVREVEQFIYQMQTMFVLETLENLRKNGRLTRLQSVITGALKIKLLMGATPEGEICKLGQTLSMKQALSKMVDHMANDPAHAGRTLAICHCNCLDRAFQVKAMAEQRCKFAHILILEAGGITSVYANDGGIVTAY
ncbi:DegV family protein [Colidextribacter sp. 210702-DFI.3.9]|uniref:DegV family protein n=1 Tax=Flintibacter faecis TaxID=2763047 RepID=A0A8J6M5M0_9FIRM|nr:DegV family protein [Flintibacter faecis]MBC5717151.1 DegV family protein [Flintibacter faecis]MCB6498889.1 DegV family protein [Colidextribacter sp. 210702-DFI.3.9]